MIRPPSVPVRPVQRRRVLAGTLLAVALIAGIVLLTETLRHPLPDDAPQVPEIAGPGADPRDEILCEDIPREGQERDTTVRARQDVREVTSNELYDCPQLWDGREVRYRGEVVGAVLRRDGGAWLHLNDDVYGDELGPLPSHRDYEGGNAGVGAFVPGEVADAITSVGSARRHGDLLEVTGVFHRVDPATREVAILRVSSGRVVEPGREFADVSLPDRRNVAVVTALLALTAVVGERIAARRR